jgi:hypothetical protein
MYQYMPARATPKAPATTMTCLTSIPSLLLKTTFILSYMALLSLTLGKWHSGIGFPKNFAERLTSILEIEIQKTFRRCQLPDGVVMLSVHCPGVFLKFLLCVSSEIPSQNKAHRPVKLILKSDIQVADDL